MFHENNEKSTFKNKECIFSATLCRRTTNLTCNYSGIKNVFQHIRCPIRNEEDKGFSQIKTGEIATIVLNPRSPCWFVIWTSKDVRFLNGIIEWRFPILIRAWKNNFRPNLLTKITGEGLTLGVSWCFHTTNLYSCDKPIMN